MNQSSKEDDILPKALQDLLKKISNSNKSELNPELISFIKNEIVCHRYQTEPLNIAMKMLEEQIKDEALEPA